MKLNLQVWPIDRVKPYAQNVKKHPTEQIDAIVASIKSTGWDVPIVVDEHGVIIKGHGRRLAAIKLGLTEVPVIIRDDLTPERVKAARLTDNRAALSDIDTEMLRLEMMEINTDLLKGIFSDKELEFTMADLGIINDSAFVPDLDAAVVAQQADMHGRADKMKVARIPLKKAFGFDSIAGADELYLSRWLAQLEVATGLKGEEAFVAHVKGMVGEVSQS